MVLTAEEYVSADQARVAGAVIYPRMELESAGASLPVNWTLAPRLSLTSISAYEHFTRLHAEDTDGTSLVFLDGTYDDRIDQYSQELRMAYDADYLKLIGGAFYSRDKVKAYDEFYALDRQQVM